MIQKSNVIELLEDSLIPSITVDQLYKEPDSANSIKSCRGRDKSLLFKEGTLFHDLQVEVDYVHTHDHWQGAVPSYQGLKLSGLRDKMKNRKEIKLVIYGDSISTGANASSKVNAEPFMPFYGELTALALESIYDCQIELCNLSKGGQSSFYGVRNIDEVVNESPDLVMIAWGMNDASGNLSAKKYQDNISEQIQLIQSSVPECEFILISTMYGNPEWTKSSPDLYPQYRDSLNELCKDGVVMADVTSVFEELLKHKRFVDLTNNGVNHPNDFGHRIYAQTILTVLLEDTNDLDSIVLQDN